MTTGPGGVGLAAERLCSTLLGAGVAGAVVVDGSGVVGVCCVVTGVIVEEAASWD